MPLWIKDGKLVIDDTGALVLCDECPCGEQPCEDCDSLCCRKISITLTGWMDCDFDEEFLYPEALGNDPGYTGNLFWDDPFNLFADCGPYGPNGEYGLQIVYEKCEGNQCDNNGPIDPPQSTYWEAFIPLVQVGELCCLQLGEIDWACLEGYYDGDGEFVPMPCTGTITGTVEECDP